MKKSNKETINELSLKIRNKFGTVSRFAKAMGVPTDAVYNSFMRIRMNEGRYVTEFDAKAEIQKWEKLYRTTNKLTN